MTMLISFVFLGLGLILIHRWRVMHIRGISPWWISAIFILKILIGVAVWFIYANVYDIVRTEADVFKYFDDGVLMAEAGREDPSLFIELFTDRVSSSRAEEYQNQLNFWDRSYELIQINDNRAMIRVNALLALISGGEYHTHSIFFNFLSLLGIILLFKGISGLHALEPWMFLVAFVLAPSLLFWASAPLKEALVLLPMGMLLYSLKDLDTKGPNFLLMILAILASVFIKPYVGLAMLPGFLFLLGVHYWKGKVHVTFLGIHLGILVLLFLSQFIPSMDVISVLSAKQKDFFNVAETMNAGSTIDIPRFYDIWTFLQACPSAVWRTYFRPGIWEMRSLLDGMAALENSGYLVLGGFVLLKRAKEVDLRMLLFCISFLIGMGVLIGTVTPVLGASVRYRAPALPFLIVVLYLLAGRSYIVDRINKIKLK